MQASRRLIQFGTSSTLFCLATLASAQRTSSVSTSSDVVIVESLAIYKTSDLRFGAIFPGLSGGTVILSPGGARTATGSVFALSTGAFGAASFAVLGPPSQTFSISLPSSITLGRSGGSESMVVSSIATSGGSPLGSGGSATLNVGGTLTLTANQAFGQYVGTFNVTVSYP